MRFALFWDVMRLTLVISYRRFGTSCRSPYGALDMRPTGHAVTSVTNCPSALRNIPEECTSHSLFPRRTVSGARRQPMSGHTHTHTHCHMFSPSAQQNHQLKFAAIPRAAVQYCTVTYRRESSSGVFVVTHSTATQFHGPLLYTGMQLHVCPAVSCSGDCVDNLLCRNKQDDTVTVTVCRTVSAFVV